MRAEKSTEGPRDWANIFQKYREQAIEAGKNLPWKDVGHTVWSSPEIVDYYSRLPLQENVNAMLAASLSEVIPSPENANILVVGGATGRLGRLLAQKYPNAKVTEVDSSTQMVAAANRLAAEEGVNDRFESVIADGFHLPFGENEFDYVFASGFIRYFSPDEQIQLIQEMRATSKYGCTIVEAGSSGEFLRKLTSYFSDSSMKEASNVPMLRMSLFYVLLRMYQSDADFKKYVDEYGALNTRQTVDVLTEIAGAQDGALFELRIPKRE